MIDIGYTGTAVTYRPGALSGGRVDEFDCGTQASIGWFLYAIVALAPFVKHPLHLTLQGITNHTDATSVDLIRTALLPQLTRFDISHETVELKIKRRGAWPLGGGEVTFKCGAVRSVSPVQFVDEGRIKRVRGVAYATRVSPQTANRMVDSARLLL